MFLIFVNLHPCCLCPKWGHLLVRPLSSRLTSHLPINSPCSGQRAKPVSGIHTSTSSILWLSLGQSSNNFLSRLLRLIPIYSLVSIQMPRSMGSLPSLPRLRNMSFRSEPGYPECTSTITALVIPCGDDPWAGQYDALDSEPVEDRMSTSFMCLSPVLGLQ